jgi:DNA-binding transcriptional LysR family regulator
MDERLLRLLRIFRAVAEAGGLTAAEARLRMERSTISRHLQALEQRLGGTLCARGPSGFALTELGRAALQAAIAASDSLDALRDRLERARDAMDGELRLGLAESCIGNPDCRLPSALAAFRVQAPDARLHVALGTEDALREDIAQRRLHIVIAELRPDADAAEPVPLFSEQRRLYVRAPDAGGEPPDVAALGAQGYGMAVREGDLRAAALARRLGLASRATARGVPALAMLVASGGYVAHLPAHGVRAHLDPGRLVEVPGAAPFVHHVAFGILGVPSQGLPPVAALFAALVRQAHGA